MTSSTSLRMTNVPCSSTLLSLLSWPGAEEDLLSAGGFAGSAPFCGEACAQATRGQIRRNTRQRTLQALFGGSVISSPRIHLERRQSFRWQQLHFYFTPFTVADDFAGTVSEDILIAEFNSNLGGDVGEIVGIINSEGAAAGEFSDVAEQLRA